MYMDSDVESQTKEYYFEETCSRLRYSRNKVTSFEPNGLINSQEQITRLVYYPGNMSPNQSTVVMETLSDYNEEILYVVRGERLSEISADNIHSLDVEVQRLIRIGLKQQDTSLPTDELDGTLNLTRFVATGRHT